MIKYTSSPCPVCSSTTKGCGAIPDGLHFCRGNADGHWKLVKKCDNGFSCYRKSDQIIRGKKNDEKGRSFIDWTYKVNKYKSRMTKELSEKLSLRLRIPDYFDRFNVGVVYADKEHIKYAIPEYDEKRVVGINVRIEANETSKIMIKGSNRGVVYPADFHGRNDIVYVVEGFTDTAACYAAGLLAIGRPNNAGGSKIISSLVNNRKVILVGENDWRLCKECQGRGCIQCNDKGYLFPGKEGAELVAGRLSKLLKRKIDWVMPPNGFKDVREYLVSLDGEWKERGKKLVNNLRAI